MRIQLGSGLALIICGLVAQSVSQARGLVSAIVIFAVALIGLGFGSLLPGLLNDHLFHDELRIGASISITVVLAVVIGLGAGLATLAPYRRDYQTVHA